MIQKGKRVYFTDCKDYMEKQCVNTQKKRENKGCKRLIINEIRARVV